MPQHISVLLDEVLTFLRPERGGVFIDATLGLGGHATALLERAGKADIQLIGIDQDPYALEFAEEKIGDRVQYMQGNFADLANLRIKKIISGADGVLMDLGVSSYQIDTPERGFSFSSEGPLDMRMDPDHTVTAATIVNTWPEFKLANLFFKYGEERLGKKIARAIVNTRHHQPFKTTTELAELISQQYHPALRNKKPHPATRVFQALRIEVNQEMNVLEKGLDAALSLLNKNGVLAVIAFHSLEDRIVKHRFREAGETGEYEILTKKPVEPTEEEERINPRSRSAKLRAIRRIS